MKSPVRRTKTISFPKLTRFHAKALLLVVSLAFLARPSSHHSETLPGSLGQSLYSGSTSYNLCGTVSEGDGSPSSGSYRADVTLGGTGGFSSSSSYQANLVSDNCLVQFLARRANRTLFRMDWADYDNDGKITVADVASAASFWQQPSSYWDFNLNGKVDIADIATIAFYWPQTLAPPFPGQGLPLGQMDMTWKNVCGFFSDPERTYCQTRI